MQMSNSCIDHEILHHILAIQFRQNLSTQEPFYELVHTNFTSSSDHLPSVSGYVLKNQNGKR